MISRYIYEGLANMSTPWSICSTFGNQVHKKIINSYFCPTATNLTADQNEKMVEVIST